MQIIRSTQNSSIKELRQLQQRKYRLKTQLYLLEGFHLVTEALTAQAPIQKLVISEKVWNEQPDWQSLVSEQNYIIVTDSVFQSLSEVPAPQGIMAVVAQPTWTSETINLSAGPLLLLDQIQDPGNLGTMVRTAAAAGFAAVILGKGCADPYGGKAIRSMQGTQFKLQLLEADLFQLLPALQEKAVTVYGTALSEHALDYRLLTAPDNHFALLMGNEGNGVAPELLQLANQEIYIPMAGQVESLNVAVAAGILMFSLKK